MEHFTPLSALFGGALIGLATSALLLLNGRIAGICGIVGGLLLPGAGDVSWRAWFVGGLLVGGGVMARFTPDVFGFEPAQPLAAVVLAGLLVGFGTRLANGCTSGHGVCGNSRFSIRSIVATCTFIAVGAITVLFRGFAAGSSP